MIINLDYYAQFYSQKMMEIINNDKIKAKDVENLVTKSLGVLQQNGVYACVVYLLSNNENTISECIVNNLLEFTEKIGIIKRNDQNTLNFISNNICNNLEKLLLVKLIWEQTLLYARYNAKARGKNHVSSV